MDAATLTILAASLAGAITAFFSGVVLVIKALGEVKQGNLATQEAIRKVDVTVAKVEKQTNGHLLAATNQASELGRIRGEADAARKAAELALVKADEMAKIATALALKEANAAIAAAEARIPAHMIPSVEATVRVADATEELVKETARVADAAEGVLPANQTEHGKVVPS